MLYDKGDAYVLAQRDRGKTLEEKQRKQRQLECTGNTKYVEVAKGTWKLHKRGLSINSTRKKYKENRARHYKSEGLKQIKQEE